MTRFYCNLNNHDQRVFTLTRNMEFVINPDCKTFLSFTKTFFKQKEQVLRCNKEEILHQKKVL